MIIDHDAGRSLLQIRWKPGCGNIVEKNTETETARIKEAVEKHDPRLILFDLGQCTYNITPESGPWYEHTLFSMFNHQQPDKLAYVVPENLFSHIFFEASRARETVDINTRVQYFNKKEKALDWLTTDQAI